MSIKVPLHFVEADVVGGWGYEKLLRSLRTAGADGSGLALHEKDWLILRVVASGEGSR